MDDTKDERLSVYEIGYLIISSVPEDQVVGEAEKIRKILAEAGALVISEEVPHRQHLAYTIRRKTVGGSYESYDESYFGWIKFEVGSGIIESIKKSVKNIPSILRILLTTTVKENTYQGKHAPALIATLPVAGEDVKVMGVGPVEGVVPVSSVEEMDKSIDEMVKEV